jgi:hypothetical protein
MTPAELRVTGEHLYGPHWQAKLARALPVSPRTIRYWLSGKRKIRPVIAERIRGLKTDFIPVPIKK